MSVRDCKLYLRYLHINQKKVQIMLKIMEEENGDTDKYLNEEENNSDQDTKRAATH